MVLPALLLVAGASVAEIPRTPATVHELFSPPSSVHAEISPSGRFAATVFQAEEGWGIRITQLDGGRTVEEFGNHRKHETYGVGGLLWDGPDSLVVDWVRGAGSLGLRHDGYYHLLNLDPRADAIVRERRVLDTPGTIIDASPARPGEVLFVHAESSDSVHRVSAKRLESGDLRWKDIEREEDDAPELVAKLDDAVIAWLVDREGAIRAAISFSENPVELRFWFREGADARWRIVRRERDVDRFEDLIPLGFTPDGQGLLVASALDRDRYGLYEYDPVRNAVGRLVYEHPTAELTGLLYDVAGREVLAAVYLEDGERRYAYLSSGSDELRRAVAKTFPGSLVSTTSVSQDRRKVTLFVSRSDDPGGFVAYDLDSGRLSQLGRVAPWLDDDLLAVTEVLEVPRPGGRAIEAFLTLPPVPGPKPPLVVMPHGGPIGVADDRGYSANVQYLARSGFAVLQVNYRGSGGQGRRFEESGLREWGRGIEDDIEAAVDRVVASGRVDGTRMCTVGASYGGYSALMLVIRSPKRYRCAASLSGVTDIALMFNVDEVTGGESLTTQMEKIVGDPEKDYEEMRRFSPVYNADKIEVPIYLAHGAWDRTVDVDHLIRMKLALDLEQAPVQSTIYARMRHGFETRDAAVRYWLSLYDFLTAHIRD